MAWFLGIDGGGSKTACVVGDENRVLGRGQAGGSNVHRVGEADARAALHQAVRGACAAGGIDPARVQRTVAGVAGSGRSEVGDFLRAVLGEVAGGEVVVVTDAEAAVHAAFGDAAGVVVIAGTGSIALAQDGAGREGGRRARAGGWGWAVSDEGSGPWIGRAAVAAILLARDEGQSAQMEQAVVRAWRLTDGEQLVRAANALPQPDFGALLPAVATAAEGGDPLASEILARAGRELGSLASLAARRLFGDAANVRVAMSGGAFAHAPYLRKAFYNGLQAQLRNAVLMPDLADPLVGAWQMARRR